MAKWKPLRRLPDRKYPDADPKRWASSPTCIVNEDGQFSSPELTAWYVASFVQMNHLKGSIK
jgi:hypothetical protein